MATELVAYPYPIGYDVINYYIPMLSNFENEWNTILREYPFYTSILYVVQNITGLSAQNTVSIFAIFIFGLFGVSVFSLGKAVIRNSNRLALLISLFVILQIPVLRTAWDLHRDMFSLTMMFFAFSILIQLRGVQPNKFSSPALICFLLFTVLSVISDRMVGAWLVIVYCICALLYRERIITISFIVGLVSFIALLTVTGDGYSIISSVMHSISDAGMNAQISGEKGPQSDSYNQISLFFYFIALNVLLIPLGIIGYVRLHDPVLRVSLIVALFGSMTWLVFPHARELVADRWILLFGISLSVIAGFGLVRIIQLMFEWLNNVYLSILVPAIIFLIFAQLGITYAVLPYEAQISMIGFFNDNIQEFVPKSMQFSSVKVDQSPMILDVIHWINENTDDRSEIIGSKDWRGWFITELTANRTFIEYERLGNISNTTIDAQQYQRYLITTKVSYDNPIRNRENSILDGIEAYSNSLFTVYRIWENTKNMN
ncbi:MAG TPA: hypothetical protein VE130_16150 [Nitrososphaeraceae archaeon]|nr:hypothetical protein [Nitrososphaeraceae archaeon]